MSLLWVLDSLRYREVSVVRTFGTTRGVCLRSVGLVLD